MPAYTSKLVDPGVCIVFAYAPAGLGHLRVTDALYHGLPQECDPMLLPDTAVSVKTLHRLTSSNPFAKRFFEWSQQGVPETIITRIYRFMLHQDARFMQKRLLELLKQRIQLPHTLVIVATHYGIAHQVSVIKKDLERLGNVRVLLVVQVTDDSPQKLWYVPHADLLCVPSEFTYTSLQTYGRLEHLGKSRIVILPYPVSPRLLQPRSQQDMDLAMHQTDPLSQVLIHTVIPISGAAVGIPYLRKLMHKLHTLEPRMRFHIIVKRSIFTLSAIRSWKRKGYMYVYESRSDREIIDLYERVYEQEKIVLEITKPSEQSFKALIPPNRQGGSILLFAPPVGRQEYDNVSFLQRNGLIPSGEEYRQLCDVLNLEQNRPIPLPISHWRGFRLSDDPVIAAKWISRALTFRIFQSMISGKEHKRSDEVSPEGVEEFWKQVVSLL